MSEKKGSASTEPQEKPVKGSFQSTKGFPPSTVETLAELRKNRKVEYFPDGVALVAPAPGRANKTSGKIKRGDVSGWSYGSRRRFREFMLTHRVPVGFDAYSFTVTVPGPILSPAEQSRLFNLFSVALNRAGGCMVWRAEVQDRGQIHWHCFGGLPSDLRPVQFGSPALKPFFKSFNDWRKSCAPEGKDADDIAIPALESGTWYNAAEIRRLWLRSLDSLGPVEHTGNSGKTQIAESRSLLCGADQRAAEVVPLPDVFGPWKRYLQDHASKAKQAQIIGYGRQWGVVGRKRVERVFPDEVAHLTAKQYARFLRFYQRLCTPYVRCEGALFGRRRGYTSKRGRSGRSVFYSSPSTVRLLVEWARYHYPDHGDSFDTSHL